jgi:hypothetical protein
MIRLSDETTLLGRFETINAAVTFLEQHEQKSAGELEWVRVQLRHELFVDVEPPVTHREYHLEHDTDWIEPSLESVRQT